VTSFTLETEKKISLREQPDRIGGKMSPFRTSKIAHSNASTKIDASGHGAHARPGRRIMSERSCACVNIPSPVGRDPPGAKEAFSDAEVAG
jgi:hypothetical protein